MENKQSKTEAKLESVAVEMNAVAANSVNSDDFDYGSDCPNDPVTFRVIDYSPERFESQSVTCDDKTVMSASPVCSGKPEWAEVRWIVRLDLMPESFDASLLPSTFINPLICLYNMDYFL